MCNKSVKKILYIISLDKKNESIMIINNKKANDSNRNQLSNFWENEIDSDIRLVINRSMRLERHKNLLKIDLE